jgi:hypothetical protein
MAATLTDLVDPAGEARRPMWGIGQASRRTGRPNPARPSGMGPKWPTGASGSLAVLPIRPALPSFHSAISAPIAAHVLTVNRPSGPARKTFLFLAHREQESASVPPQRRFLKSFSPLVPEFGTAVVAEKLTIS